MGNHITLWDALLNIKQTKSIILELWKLKNLIKDQALSRQKTNGQVCLFRKVDTELKLSGLNYAIIYQNGFFSSLVIFLFATSIILHL